MSEGRAKPDLPRAGEGAPQRPAGSLVDAAGFQTDQTRALMRAWEVWRRDALLPSRADMNLEDISTLLSTVVLIEVRGPEEAIIRLAGTAICDAFGQELKGHNCLDWMPPSDRQRRAGRIRAIAGQPCGALLAATYRTRSDMSFRTELLALPIRPVATDSPMQIITVVARLRGQPRPTHVAASELARMPDSFRYLDIGAGAPDDLG